MRSPVNVLVLPFRGTVEEGFSYAVFRRSDGDASCWQAVEGGQPSKSLKGCSVCRALHSAQPLPRHFVADGTGLRPI